MGLKLFNKIDSFFFLIAEARNSYCICKSLELYMINWDSLFLVFMFEIAFPSSFFTNFFKIIFHVWVQRVANKDFGERFNNLGIIWVVEISNFVHTSFWFAVQSVVVESVWEIWRDILMVEIGRKDLPSPPDKGAVSHWVGDSHGALVIRSRLCCK